jgi:hypothetical protein
MGKTKYKPGDKFNGHIYGVGDNTAEEFFEYYLIKGTV